MELLRRWASIVALSALLVVVADAGMPVGPGGVTAVAPPVSPANGIRWALGTGVPAGPAGLRRGFVPTAPDGIRWESASAESDGIRWGTC